MPQDIVERGQAAATETNLFPGLAGIGSTVVGLLDDGHVGLSQNLSEVGEPDTHSSSSSSQMSAYSTGSPLRPYTPSRG
ncbi:MAG TPA: hypothetical protein VIG24_02010, partial [Acidimicrobiia bacterium]